MKKYSVLPLLLCSTFAHADFYIDAGVGFAVGDTSIDETVVQNDANAETVVYTKTYNNPFGRLALGYEAMDNWYFELEHISSIPRIEEHSGFNVFWVNKRIWF